MNKFEMDDEFDKYNKTPDYCTQNNGDCPSCSLTNYGLDCANNRILTLGVMAEAITFGNLQSMAKLLYQDGNMRIDPDLAEYDPNLFIPRLAAIDLFAMRSGDRVGHKVAELLNATSRFGET
jgi:hypothetical protein